MTDSYEDYYNDAKKKIDKLNDQLNDYNAVKSQGGNVTKKIYLVNATYKVLSVNIKNLEKCKYDYEDNPSNFRNLSERERETRLQRITVLLKDYEQVNAMY